MIYMKVKKVYPPKHAPKPKFFHFKGEDGIEYSLTPQQKAFCEFFCQFSMNGVDAVIEAGYNINNKRGVPDLRVAASIASENLRKPNICCYIDTILAKYGLADDHADKQLAGLINQWDDLGAKVRALDILYKKKGSYAPEKFEHGLSMEVQRIMEYMKKILPSAK